MITEQDILKSYAEAQRYMSNAEETLQRSGKEDNLYLDVKYVRVACGTAYLAVLIAADMWLALKGVSMPVKRDIKKKHRDINKYREDIGGLDGRMLANVNTAYNILHLYGYYDGIQDVRIVHTGFAVAREIIEKIKPTIPDADIQQYLAAYKPKRPSFLKQIYSFLFL
jgi:hypothetical protein